LGRCFANPRLARAGWTEEQHSTDWSVRRAHADQKYLVQATHAAHCPLLSDDAGRKPLLEILSARALLIRVEEDRLFYLVRVFHLDVYFSNHGRSSSSPDLCGSPVFKPFWSHPGLL